MLSKLNLSLTARTMCKVLGALFAVFLVIGLGVIWLIYPFEPPFAYLMGLVLGFLLSASKVVLLERMLERSVGLEEKQAKNYGSLQSILRYFLTVVILLLVVFFPKVFGLWGAVVGLLSLQLSAFLTGRLLRGKNLDQPAEKI